MRQFPCVNLPSSINDRAILGESSKRTSKEISQLLENFSDDLFVGSVPDEFRCVICLHVMRDPVTLVCKCAVNTCRKCAELWFQSQGGHQICPRGRDPVSSLVPNIPTRTSISNMHIRCMNSEKGCTWTGPLSTFESHSKECLKALVVCPSNPACASSMKMMREELAAHELTCEHAPVHCEHCGAPYARRLMPAHRDICPSAPMPCPRGCGMAGLLRSTVDRHEMDECPKKFVKCTVPNCRQWMERGLIPRHMEANVKLHLDLVVQQNQELQLAADEYKKSKTDITHLEERLLREEFLNAELSLRLASLERLFLPKLHQLKKTEKAIKNFWTWDPRTAINVALSDGNMKAQSRDGGNGSYVYGSRCLACKTEFHVSLSSFKFLGIRYLGIIQGREFPLCQKGGIGGHLFGIDDKGGSYHESRESYQPRNGLNLELGPKTLRVIFDPAQHRLEFTDTRTGQTFVMETLPDEPYHFYRPYVVLDFYDVTLLWP